MCAKLADTILKAEENSLLSTKVTEPMQQDRSIGRLPCMWVRHAERSSLQIINWAKISISVASRDPTVDQGLSAISQALCSTIDSIHGNSHEQPAQL